jgi:hypothetical protein
MKAKRKTKRKAKSARRAKPSQVQRTLVRLEKVMAAQALRLDGLEATVEKMEKFLGRHLAVFHDEQTTAPVTNGPQAGALVDPE